MRKSLFVVVSVIVMQISAAWCAQSSHPMLPKGQSKSRQSHVKDVIDASSIHWSISVTHDTNLVPTSVMYLMVNKKSVWYIRVPGNDMKPMEPDHYDAWKVPKAVIAPAFGWFAGSGDIFYIKRVKNTLRIYRREMDESETEEMKPVLVKTLRF